MNRTGLVLGAAFLAIAPISNAFAAISYMEGHAINQALNLAFSGGTAEGSGAKGFGLKGWLGIGNRWALHFENQVVNEDPYDYQFIRFGGSIRMQYNEYIEPYFRVEAGRLEFDVPEFTDRETQDDQGNTIPDERADLVSSQGFIYSLGVNTQFTEQLLFEVRGSLVQMKDSDNQDIKGGDQEIDGYEFDVGFTYLLGEQLALSISYRELILDIENNNNSALDFRDVRAGFRYYLGVAD